MKNNFFKLVTNGYLRYINNREFTTADGLAYWRERIFNGLIFVVICFGTVAIVPNLIAAITTKSHLITVTDLLIYACILFLFFYPSLKFQIKVWIVIFDIYLLSIVLLVTLGPFGPGFVWLAGSSFLAALLIGTRASIITILVNVFIIVALAILINFKVFDTIFFTSYTTGTWIAVSINVIVFNAMTSIPLTLILDALEKLLSNEKQLKAELIKHNDHISKEKDMALESDRLKSAFLANLSHEIRTPMNAIVGFSELISKDIGEEHRLGKFSNYIIQNSKYLLNLISDIVEISIIESGQMILHNSFITLEQILRDLQPTIESSSKRFNRDQVVIQYAIEPDLFNLELFIDQTRLKQVFINLITNALKYTPEGKIVFMARKHGQEIKFSIKDTGVGIPEAEKLKIFTRFSKINRNGKFSMPGIGLGLSITKGLCEAMGGYITFESEENTGTRFDFTIPVSISIEPTN